MIELDIGWGRDINQAIEYEDTLGKDCHYKIIASTDKKLGLPQPSPEYKQQYFKEYNAYNVKDILVDYERHSKE